MHINFGRFNGNYLIIDTKTAQTIELTKGAAKAVCRFLMKELNVINAQYCENGEIFDLFKVDNELRELKND